MHVRAAHLPQQAGLALHRAELFLNARHALIPHHACSHLLPGALRRALRQQCVPRAPARRCRHRLLLALGLLQARRHLLPRKARALARCHIGVLPRKARLLPSRPQRQRPLLVLKAGEAPLLGFRRARLAAPLVFARVDLGSVRPWACPEPHHP